MMILPNSKWMMNNSRIMENIIHKSDIDKLNPSLIIDKYLFWEGNSLAIDFDKRAILNNKMSHLKNAVNLNPTLTLEHFEYLKNRKNSLPDKLAFNLTTRTRLIVNHGGESILDNSIALHTYYGFPIIPGSAIKGVARHFCEEFENLDTTLINKIFGNSPNDKESEEGGIIFIDAWPVNIEKFLEIDVFTPHYQKYYQGQSLPRDDQKPIPVNFLAVKKGIKFEFAIAPTLKCKKEDRKSLINETKGIIIKTLKTFGIGSKTGSNYGYFQ